MAWPSTASPQHPDSFSFIGTDLIGLDALGNAKAGIYLGPGSYDTTVGSTDPSLPTVISGNLGDGIEMRGTHGNTVVGSLIGTDHTGLLPLPNAGDGVFLSNSSNNVIGRTSAGSIGMAANIIAFNDADGVFVASGNGNAIRQNSIFGNTLLGIDLGASANANQAAPVLTSVITMPLGMQIYGTLTSKPNATFTIEFFANATDAPSGRTLLGVETVHDQCGRRRGNQLLRCAAARQETPSSPRRRPTRATTPRNSLRRRRRSFRRKGNPTPRAAENDTSLKRKRRGLSGPSLARQACILSPRDLVYF